MYNGCMEQQIIDNFANSDPNRRLLLLDYDGTLTPIVPRPEQAKPNQELRELLGHLSTQADVVIISGRNHTTLDEWLGDLPDLDFGAEHGLFLRQNGGEWQTTQDIDPSWKEPIRSPMQKLCDQTPGSLLEEATGTLNWHYRDVSNQQSARAKAEELMKKLEPKVRELNLSMLDGSKVVTVKLGGVDKGRIAQNWLKMKNWDFVLAAGDDTTDEDLFRAMPPNAHTIKIGEGKTQARQNIASVEDFLQLLQALISNKS